MDFFQVHMFLAQLIADSESKEWAPPQQQSAAADGDHVSTVLSPDEVCSVAARFFCLFLAIY
jgi:hypothetical protein